MMVVGNEHYFIASSSATSLFSLLWVQWLMDHPKFYNNPLYIAGDSYAGMIVAIVVQEISGGKLVTLLNLSFC